MGFFSKKGNSNTQERISIIDRFISVFGVQKIICLLADREFIGKKWFGYLIDNKILFRVRIKKSTLVSNAKGKLVPVKNFFHSLTRGNYLILNGKRTIWGHRLYIIGLKMTDGTLVIIATQENPETVLDDYKERWEIETLFGCLKTRGFRFESTHMTDPDRVKKLVAYLSIAFCLAHIIGEWLNEQKPIKIKKHNRLAKSIFRYGLDYLRSCLLNESNKQKIRSFGIAMKQVIKIMNCPTGNCCTAA